ncbi:MAG: DegT/DnrJ/EryC1/StrS aminotransferase [Acidimicrobiaceae bacterium]|nr:DegT/DnrJ/EryC1/StrS aminotransferase [Acidimicrobiaceae bacterium]
MTSAGQEPSAVAPDLRSNIDDEDSPASAERRLESARDIRQRIIGLVEDYVAASQREEGPFVPGRTPVRYAGRVYDEREVTNLVNASLDFWLTEGRYSAMLEKALAQFVGVGFCRLVNSGSSANLAAFSSLTSARLGERRVQRGDEVITLAAGFPTTVAPIVQHGAVPVFVDANPRTANVDITQLEEAFSSRTRAVMFAHTLGNPFDIDAVLTFCRRHDLWLVEDNCDALGSRYTTQLGDAPDTRYTGTFGDLATSSFYPPHHMTTGEGGAVYTDSEELDDIAASFRDWGRDCYCKSGKDNTCGIRFEHQLGELPFGYDHKYTYSHFGYNLKMTDLQASIGLAQIAKVADFGAARRRNFAYLRENLAHLGEVFDFTEATPRSDPSWFGFLATVREDAPFTRGDIVSYLEGHRVQTRMLFAGNLVRHPCFDEMRERKSGYRVIGDLPVTDRLMERAFWVGVYPGMGIEHLDYMIEQFIACCDSFGVH